MKIISEIDLGGFRFYGGAETNIKLLTADELKQLDQALSDLYSDGLDRTQLNDLVWFDFGRICQLIGLQYDSDKMEIIR